EQARLLLQLDDHDGERRRVAGHVLMRDGVRVHGAAAAHFLRLQIPAAAVPTRRLRVVHPRLAYLAAQDLELPSRGRLPEERGLRIGQGERPVAHASSSAKSARATTSRPPAESPK